MSWNTGADSEGDSFEQGTNSDYFLARPSNSVANMPKETRPPSQQYRQAPITLPQLVPEASSGLRPTTIWTQDDDEILMNARASGKNWAQIAEKNFPNKTSNACRKRHERLMERRNAEDWDGVKLETISNAYMEVRRAMWTLLAERVNEKWQTVEAKCMERGLKNIQALHRSASRKARGMDGDSGIGSPDAEYAADQANVEQPRAETGSFQQQDYRAQPGFGYGQGKQREVLPGPSQRSQPPLEPPYPESPRRYRR